MLAVMVMAAGCGQMPQGDAGADAAQSSGRLEGTWLLTPASSATLTVEPGSSPTQIVVTPPHATGPACPLTMTRTSVDATTATLAECRVCDPTTTGVIFMYRDGTLTLNADGTLTAAFNMPIQPMGGPALMCTDSISPGDNTSMVYHR